MQPPIDPPETRTHGQASPSPGGQLAGFPPDSTSPGPASSTARFSLLDPQGRADAPAGEEGRYQILGEIARGGMGAILKGRDAALGRDLAIKVLLEKYAENAEVVGRFLEEAQIGGQLQHPGIVPIYDLGRFADQRPFFAMKLVKGETLAVLLKRRDSPREALPEFLRIFQQVCETMAYAHSRGVIHRDLKPLNIMVGAFGEVQVMDWGLAKVIGREESTEAAPLASVIRTDRTEAGSKLTQVGDLMGTVAYMSPEQARGEMDRLDERADVFALGSILCEILTTKAAYTGRSSQELLDKAKIGALPEALSRLHACGAEPDLIAIATACLSPIAEDRPRDAAEVARLTKAYLDGVQERLRAAEIARAEANARAEHEQQARILNEAKAAQERRARRLTVALAGAVLVAGLIGGGSWLAFRLDREAQLARTERVVGDALARAETLHAEAKRSGLDDLDAWTRAMSASDTAKAALSGRPARADLAERVGRTHETIAEGTQQARNRAERRESGRKLVAALDEARLEGTSVMNDHFDADARIGAYVKAFREAGIDITNSSSEELARRLAGRGDPVVVAAALTDWAFYEDDKSRRIPLLSMARRIDPDPYRNRIRDAIAEANATALVSLAAAEEASSLPASTILQLARGLQDTGKRAEAISLLDRSRSHHPADFWIHHHLGVMILVRDPSKIAASVRFLSIALALKPDSPGAQLNLGLALLKQGMLAEAEASYRAALRLKPDYAEAHRSLGTTLSDQGRPAEAEASYRAALQYNPDDASTHYGLGCILTEQGRLAEAEASYRAALHREPNYPEANCNLGHNLLRQRRYVEARDAFRRGHEASLKRPDWPYPSAGWVAHSEAMVQLESRLPALLKGEAKPANNADRYAVGQLCYDTRRFGHAARFWGEALADDPTLAVSNRRIFRRYNAACAAALAGTGQGDDDPKPDETARAALRAKARGWLVDELAAWARVAESGKPGDRNFVAELLLRWKQDSDLAVIRDAEALAKLPEEERQAWRAFWADVDAILKKVQAR